MQQIRKEFVGGGMRIRHPSGVTVTHTIEDLRRLKEFNQQVIDLAQEQIRRIERDMAEVEAQRETRQKP